MGQERLAPLGQPLQRPNVGPGAPAPWEIEPELQPAVNHTRGKLSQVVPQAKQSGTMSIGDLPGRRDRRAAVAADPGRSGA